MINSGISNSLELGAFGHTGCGAGAYARQERQLCQEPAAKFRWQVDSRSVVEMEKITIVRIVH
jgi:hypothetical protein